MKVRTKTIGGFYSPDFEQRVNDYVKSELNGFKELTCFESLRKKHAAEKVIIKVYRWHGEWTGYKKEIYSIYYR